MYIESIDLSHYRNYDSANLKFSPGVNIFFGDNAQGKTNLLEAIYVSGTTKSHRNSKDKELIHFGEEEAHIRLFFHKKDLSHRLDVHLRQKKGKGIAIDGMPVKKTGDLLGMLHVVFFSPEDLSIIKDGPVVRRKFLDMEMSQLDKGYMNLLVSYNKILNERNNLLKQIKYLPQLEETLDGWDDQLVRVGSAIIKKRQDFIVHIDEMMRKVHESLSGGREIMKVGYEVNVLPENFAEELALHKRKDIDRGSTSVGPHRDDIQFIVNDIDIRRFGSQGQQRTAALSLKLSEIRLIEQMSGDQPVLLLDDVLSELDSHRQKFLLENISDIQTMISCTGLDEFVNSRLHLDKIFHVEQGVIKEYEGA